MKKHAVQILKTIIYIIKTCLIVYAITFSIAGTAALVYAYATIVKPIRQVIALSKHNPAETAYMKTYRLERKAQGKSDKLVQIFVPLDSISKQLQKTVIAAEDDGFYTHPGIDIEAILRAAEYNRDHNKIVRGASTITQQLAKNLFLDADRNFGRKVKELGYTLLLEKYLTKDRILELYLNYAQWGDTIFGCEAASQTYYKKSAKKLSLSEASRMAATLAMPSKVTPLNTKSVFIKKRMEAIANNLYMHHILDDTDYTIISGMLPPKDSLIDSTASEDSTEQ